jgi:hypothetical protein
LTLINKGIYYNQLKQKGGYMKIQGIEVNPTQAETQAIAGFPFVLTTSFLESQSDITYEDLAAFGMPVLLTRAEFDANRLEQRKTWFAAYPSGICFEVRVSDGGCIDRSSSCGRYPPLDQAITAAKELF